MSERTGLDRREKIPRREELWFTGFSLGVGCQARGGGGGGCGFGLSDGKGGKSAGWVTGFTGLDFRTWENFFLLGQSGEEAKCSPPQPAHLGVDSRLGHSQES